MSSAEQHKSTKGPLRTLVGTLAGLALLMSAYSATTRYLFPSFAYGWIDELVVYLIVWAMWLAGSLLVSENKHVKADIVDRILSPVWAARIHAAITAIGFVFCSLMAYGGAIVVALSIRLGEYSDSTIALPLWTYYIGFPVGMLLMAWQYARVLLTSREQQQ